MLEPLSRKTLANQVATELQKYIVTNGIVPGDRLPSETELTTALDVSRSTVREALKSLELIGMVTRRPRRGCVLQEMDMNALAEAMEPAFFHSEDDINELFIARKTLEVAALPLVAERAVEADYARMESALSRVEDDLQAHRVPVDEDIAFHEALMGAAGNKFLTQISALVRAFFRTETLMPLVNRMADDMDTDGFRESLDQHRQIIAALRRGDVVTAQRVMQEHLNAYVRTGKVSETSAAEAMQSVPAAS